LSRLTLLQAQQQFWQSIVPNRRGDYDSADFDNINVYRTNVMGTKLRALADTFSTVKAYLGQSRFQYLAKLYVLNQPCSTNDLNYFGENFAEFIKVLLADNVELAKYDGLVDLANIDFAHSNAFFAEDEWLCDQTDPKNLQQTVVLAKHVSVLQSQFDLIALKQAVLSADIAELHLNKANYYFVIYRNNNQVFEQHIDLNLYQLLTNLKSGYRFCDYPTMNDNQISQLKSALIDMSLLTRLSHV